MAAISSGERWVNNLVVSAVHNWSFIHKLEQIKTRTKKFADDIFKLIFSYENFCILIEISLQFVP